MNPLGIKNIEYLIIEDKKCKVIFILNNDDKYGVDFDIIIPYCCEETYFEIETNSKDFDKKTQIFKNNLTNEIFKSFRFLEFNEIPNTYKIDDEEFFSKSIIITFESGIFFKLIFCKIINHCYYDHEIIFYDGNKIEKTTI